MLQKTGKFHVKLLFILLFPAIVHAQKSSSVTLEQKPLPSFPNKLPLIQNEIDQNTVGWNLTVEEKEWYYWTNYCRLYPMRFWDSVVTPILRTFPQLQSSYTQSLKIDLERAGTLPMLIPDKKLSRIAQLHSSDIASKKAPPSHQSTKGESFQDRMKKAGVKTCAAENISVGDMNPILSLVFLYIDQNLPDVGHRKNLLNPEFTLMGIGIEDYRKSSRFVTQDFSCKQ